MDEELFTIEQTAIYLKVCDKTVRRLIKNNKLKASRVGRSWRIKRSEIEVYLRGTENSEGGKK